MRKLLLVFVSFTLLLTSCGNKPKERAEELCECLKKDGLSENSTEKDVDKIMQNAEMNMLQYVGVLADIQKDMKELDNDDRGDYVKTFMQALLDTDCMGIVLKAIPYDDLLKQDIKNLAGGSIDSYSKGGVNNCGEYEVTFENDKEIYCDGPGCDCRDEDGEVVMFEIDAISNQAEEGEANAQVAGEGTRNVVAY